MGARNPLPPSAMRWPLNYERPLAIGPRSAVAVARLNLVAESSARTRTTARLAARSCARCQRNRNLIQTHSLTQDSSCSSQQEIRISVPDFQSLNSAFAILHLPSEPSKPRSHLDKQSASGALIKMSHKNVKAAIQSRLAANDERSIRRPIERRESNPID